MINIKVGKNESGQRFDKLLMKILKEAPSSFVFKMLRKKNITLNGKKAEGNEKVSEGDEISFFLAQETFDKFAGKAEETKTSGISVPSLKPSEIVYEDEDFLLVNKPVGELSQKAKDEDISVNERIVSYLSEKGIGRNEAFTPGVCNRIDRNTSGLVIAGKSLAGLQEAARLLKSHELKKFYLCIAVGNVKLRGKVTSWINKDEKTNKAEVSETPKNGYEKIEAELFPLLTSKEYSLLAVRLITGKTHQIRAQLAAFGHPLAGDTKYGYKALRTSLGKAGESTGAVPKLNLNYQLLHAYMLVFPKDTGNVGQVSGKCISCAPPEKFKNTAVKIFKEEDYLNAVMEFTRTQGIKS
ncbi:MAG: RluA family pseudouridine synthase [Lachnospiraceae bacterium]|nr:RluA family pseudouridine synthase [Lachnospiraceae bacterium]